MKISIDGQRAIDLLRMAADTKGRNYTYTASKNGGCSYTTANDSAGDLVPSCIVGHALAYAGVPIDVLYAIDYGGVEHVIEDDDPSNGVVTTTDMLNQTTINAPEVLAWLTRNGIELSQDAVDYFRTAQEKQDSGYTWGYALDIVKEASR